MFGVGRFLSTWPTSTDLEPNRPDLGRFSTEIDLFTKSRNKYVRNIAENCSEQRSLNVYLYLIFRYLFDSLFSRKKCYHHVKAIFLKKFREIKSLSFPEKVFFFVKMHWCCTLWKLREFSLTHFWQKFRESNGFIK